jgi:signal transduction histidine kinase
MPLAIEQVWFAREELVALSWLREACEAHRDEIISEARARLPCGSPLSLDELSARALWNDLLSALSGNVSFLAARTSAYGARAACAGVELRGLSEALESVRRCVVHLLIVRYRDQAERLEGALFAMQRMFDRALSLITREYLLYREALMEEQRRKQDRARRRAAELESENHRILEASRLKSEFLANMSHELRTPLNSIIGFTDLLYDGEIAPGAPQQREFLGDILKSSRHLLKLINDVLDLAKVEAGKMEFRPEPISLSQLIGEVSDVLSSLACRNQLELNYEVSPDVDQVMVDPGRLAQVLYNYLSNALKCTPAGGRVRVRAFAIDQSVFRIEVEDNGIGISANDMRRLFVEFEQIHDASSGLRSGTGLGLALTKRIAEAQGGTVGVSSAPGEGSVFWVQLPGLDPDRQRRPQSYFEELRSTGSVEAARQRSANES